MSGGTQWTVPGRGASVAELLSAAIMLSEFPAEGLAIRLVRHFRHEQTNTERTSLALTGRVIEQYDINRAFEAIRRVVTGEDARDLARAVGQ